MYAVEFSIPDSPCVIFFHQPFNGEIMGRVLSNIHTSLLRSPRPLFLTYVNLLFHDLFMRQAGMRVLRTRD